MFGQKKAASSQHIQKITKTTINSYVFGENRVWARNHVVHNQFPRRWEPCLLGYKGKHLPGIISQLLQASSPRNIRDFSFFLRKRDTYNQWASASHSAEFITVYIQF